MSEIPEDIYGAADEMATRLMQPHATTHINALRLFARAIFAERERCAEVVYSYLSERDEYGYAGALHNLILDDAAREER